MRALASFIMKGRMQAVLITVLFSGLSIVVPPLIYFSGGAVALVTLRMGLQQAAVVVLLAILIMSAISMVATGSPIPGLVFAAMVWVPVAILAQVLRQTISLGLTVGIACGVGMLAVLAGYLLIPDPVQMWQDLLLQILPELGSEAEQLQLGDTVSQAAKMMTGILAVALALNVLFSLLVGRWWQAMLYNPGGFREEFHQLRLPKLLAIVALFSLLLSWLAGEGAELLAGNLLIVLVFFYLLQGLAICHAVVTGRGMHIGWLVGLYVLMLIALPQMTVLLVLLALADSWVDFRNRFVPQSPDKSADEQDGGN